MGWTYEERSKVWKCSDYSDLQSGDIDNFAEYGQPYSPYEPGFDQSLTPDFSSIVIEMPQAEVMTNGYGKNVKADDFPVVQRFLKEKLNFPFGQYTFDQLVRLGFAKPPDRSIIDSLYGSPLAIAVPGSIEAPDAAYVHGTVRFCLMKSTMFSYKDQRRDVYAEIGAGDDNWDFNSSTVPRVIEAFVAAALGPTHYNLEAPIKINFTGSGKKSWVNRQCFDKPLQFICKTTKN